MKKTTTIFLSLMIICISLLSFAGCSSIKKGISTIEDLYAMESGKSYKLSNDIDLQGRNWTPLVAQAIDGNGYTIKNAVIIDSSNASSVGFFAKIKSIKNITFDNISLKVSSSGNDDSLWVDFGIAAGQASEMENVTVKNCKADFTCNKAYSEYDKYSSARVGAIAGSKAIGLSSDMISDLSSDTKLLGCKVENCEITCVAKIPVLVGGLIGEYEGQIKNSSVKDLNLTAASTNSYVYCGGVLGNTDATRETLSSCSVENLSATIGATGSVYFGGAVGVVEKSDSDYKYKISKIKVSGCELLLKANSAYVGGICGFSGGELTDCLSSKNIFNVDDSKDKNIYVGGVCGSNDITIRNCVAQACEFKGDNIKNIYYAGVIGNAAAAVVGCVASNNIYSVESYDAFVGTGDKVHDSYVIAEDTQIANKMNVDLASLQDSESIFNKTKLNKEYWSLGSDGLFDIIL